MHSSPSPFAARTAGVALAALLLTTALTGATTPAAAISALPVLTQVGPNTNAQLGLAVASAGDFNGDGWPDFVVGAPFASGGGASRGEAWLYWGGPGLDATADLVLRGEANYDQFGQSARGCGDVNGDGWNDLVVGAPNNDAVGNNSGRAYVFFGGPAADATADLVLTGEAANDQFGWSVAGPGDLDGGGPEFVVGAPGAQSAAGRAYVYHGGAALDAVVDVIIQGPAGVRLGWFMDGAGDFDADGWPDLLIGANFSLNAWLYRGGAAFDGVADYTFTGEVFDDRFGYGLGRAGDFNGDGYDDIIIGGMHNDTGGYDAGRAYLYYGGPTPNTVADLIFTGTDYRGIFGRTVAGAGDLNADGYDDLLIGAPTPDFAGLGPGRMFVFLGGDPLGAHPPDNVADLTITGENESDRLGAQLAMVGDLNGDGRDEFAVGANLYDAPSRVDAGKLYVYRVPNEMPVAAADTATVLENGSVAIAVLANDTDRDGTLLVSTLRVTAPPAHGAAVADTATGLVTYAPDPGWSGSDAFSYDVRDNELAPAAPALVTVIVTPLNARPIALADSAATPQDSSVTVPVLANDSDPDGALVPASLAVTVAPAHGVALVDTVAGAVVYTPAPGFAGRDTLFYTVADNEGAVSDPARVVITVPDTAAPGAVTAFTAAPGAGCVALAWSGVPADADSLELWRALWRDDTGLSAYPRYDDAPGSAPPVRPADRVAALADTLWTRVIALPAAAVAFTDSLPVRGVYHYEVFARDAAGNWGPRADAGPRATSYRLGDLALPADGVVDGTDVALLVADYGKSFGDSAFDPASDIGPTDDGSGAGVPLTDGRLDFEDVMIAAVNYGPPATGPTPAGQATLGWRRVDESVWALRLDAANPSLKGLRLTADLPPGITAAVTPGPLLALQAAPAFLRNDLPDHLDIALVLLGAGAGFDGTGELLRVTLSAYAPFAPQTVVARAVDNSPLPSLIQIVTGVPEAPRFALAQNSPNPFNPATTIRFALPAAGPVRLVVFDPRGRRVAALVEGEMAAGDHAILWRGLDDRGAAVASGAYLYRLEAAGRVETRRMTLVR